MQKNHLKNFSKKQINKSGKYLADNFFNYQKNYLSEDELDKHLEVIYSWRASHSYVMNLLYITLKRRICSLKIDKAIIVQRLKRTPSILSKLARFNNMKLSRMQDIAGVRIIVGKISDIYKIRDNIKENFKHEIRDEKNYINEPKPDGYRCLHMIFETKGLTNDNYNGLNVELQIRTELQHQWATAVEIIGLYQNTSYKSGLGDEDTREFLCLCSNLLAIKEGTPIDHKYHGKTEKDLCHMLIGLNDKLHLLDYLKGLAKGLKLSSELPKNLPFQQKLKCYLLILNIDSKRLSIKGFPKIDDAKIEYNKIEKEIKQDQKNWDIVLVSASDIKSLKKAYPNYYMDAKKFIGTIENFIEKCAI